MRVSKASVICADPPKKSVQCVAKHQNVPFGKHRFCLVLLDRMVFYFQTRKTALFKSWDNETSSNKLLNSICRALAFFVFFETKQNQMMLYINVAQFKILFQKPQICSRLISNSDAVFAFHLQLFK